MVEPCRMQSLIFNPIWRKGGHYGPDDYEKLWGFYRIRARPPKIIDFDPFIFEWPHESNLWNLFSKFLKNQKNSFISFDIKNH